MSRSVRVIAIAICLCVSETVEGLLVDPSSSSHFGKVVLLGVETIEDASNTYCDLKMLCTDHKLFEDWNILHDQNAPKPYEIHQNTSSMMEHKSISTLDGRISRSKSLSLCTNILIPVPGTLFVSSAQQKLHDLISNIKLVGRLQYDRFIFVCPEREVLSSFFDTFAKNFDGMNLVVGIFINLSKPGYFAQPKVYSGVLQEQYEAPKSLSIHRKNLAGRTILVTTTPLPPYFTLNNATGKQYGGFHFNIFKHVSSEVNCTFIYDTIKKPTGDLLPNGSWTGMMKRIIDPSDPTEIAMMMGLNEVRYPAVDFTQFAHQDQVIFFIAQPRVLVKWGALFYPLSPSLWCCIIITFVTFLPILYASFTYSSTDLGISHSMTRKSVTNLVVWTAYSLSVEQNFHIKHSTHAFRFILGLWMFFTFITGIAYKSNLVGFLSFPTVESIPQSFENLYEQKEYNLHFHYVGGAGFSVFNYSSRAIYKSLLKRFKLENDAEMCVVKAAIKKKTVCIGWLSIVTAAVARRLTLSRQVDPLRLSREIAGYNYVGVALRKHSIFTESLNRFVSELRDTGHVEKWKREILDDDKAHGKEWFQSQNTTEVYKSMRNIFYEMREAKSVRPMELKSFASVFTILLFGCTLASTVFLLEFKNVIISSLKK
jgi:hypothetical protein